MKTRNADELLKKIQKGATAGFNVQDWLFCLDVLGWNWTKNTFHGEAQYTIIAENGSTFTLKKLPGYRVVTFYEFLPWAKAQGLLAAVEKKIGPAPVKKTRQELEENTGTCPCCFGGFKLKASTGGYLGMVFHGYKRPGIGYTIGECYGRGYAPYEVNCLGTERFLEVVKHHEAGLVISIERLRAEPDELWVADRRKEERVVKKGEANYAYTLANQISEREYQLRQCRRDIAFLEGKIRDWKPQPLPGQKSTVA